jgi:hypothetical protein
MLSIVYSLYRSNRRALVHSGKRVSYNPYSHVIPINSINTTLGTYSSCPTFRPTILDMNPEIAKNATTGACGGGGGELRGNEKRKQSCKNVGGEKKKVGHDRERDFLKQYNVDDLDKPTEYGPKSDTTIHPEHPICDVLANTLGVSRFNVSNKSGANLQFTLGRIPELETITEETFQPDSIRAIFNKYLKKSHSDRPADLLVYKDIANARWVFFNMDHIVEFIVNNCTWRKLETGRVKGDFADKSKKGMSQYLTYEFRDTHNSYFLGLNGGKGIKFIELLMDAEMGIPYYCDAFRYSVSTTDCENAEEDSSRIS